MKSSNFGAFVYNPPEPAPEPPPEPTDDGLATTGFLALLTVGAVVFLVLKGSLK